ncbi:ribosomal RNA small subunit methyltransferase A [bacterium BMS3Abin15]|nr:ribosomal RNA small subunit methyltransferase A [bacterium BMS3Abin15]HDH07695.1 16S rRNA (adenine(1518)-N(6)/adenine(1519)-N(6))-dimethyltransferase [Candidatus Moranbacteria bacterium]HDZ85631.1 16S rRNA (adenine(1518)-N(6)/adenine(1519)-N(6))-dimethyltransferase [Candidatus Moranbacteria bacterium]
MTGILMPEKLGQHFLNDKNIVEKIIKAAKLRPSDVVIEIGPGKGILTENLAKYAGKVIAVELDNKLADLLRNKFKNQKNVEIVEKDILKVNIVQFFSRHSERSVAESKNLMKKKLDPSATLGMTHCAYKIVANLPYYITSPIIRKFLETQNPPSEMILMVQKEVAERIVASPSEIPTESRGAKRISRGKPGKMSILSVSVQYYAKPEILFYVDKEKFDPVPKVDSAVIKISNIKNQSAKLRKDFFRIVKAGFCAKRKTLVNNLSNSLHLDKKEVEGKLKKTGIDPTIRAQELSVDDWKKIAELF